MNIETTDTVGVAARIQNIETINANGTYVGVGYDASSTAGTQNLNVSTSIVGGTASVIGASSINVANINAGANIATLNVTAAIGGTRDVVNVDGGSATNVNLNAATAGISKFDATIADKATLTVAANGVLNEYTANVGATATITSTTPTATKAFTINAAKDSVVTISSKLTDVALNAAGNTDFNGAGNVTAKVATANIDDQAMTSTGTGTLTVEVTGDAASATAIYKDIQADTINLKTTQSTGTLTVNANSTVNLLATGSQTLDVENATGTTGVSAVGAGKGTLNLKVSNSQTAITTGAAVGTLLIEATPDETADTKDGAQITVATLTAGAGNSTIVASGAADLKIGTSLTSTKDLVFTATQMTGKLVIGDTTTTKDMDLTIIGGSNDDTIGMTVVAATAATETSNIVLAGAGNDTVTIKGAGTSDSNIVKVYGEDGDDTINAAALTATGKEIILDGGAGNDTITGSNFVDTIVGGAGNDIISSGAGADKITLGAGNDTVIVVAGNGNDVIADAVIGEDTIVLRGVADNTAALDVTALTVSSGNYAAKLGAAHAFTLTGSTATNLSGLVQFGDATTAYTAAANLDLTTGSKNDVVTTAGTSKKINLGAGDDKITVTGAVTGSITGGAGADTFVIGANAIITDLSAGDILNVTAGTVGVTVTESFTAAATTVNAAATTTLTLNQGVDIDMTLASVAIATNGYLIKTATGGDYKLTDGATIVGSVGNDTITGSDFADIITGGNGADTITAGKGNDTINLASAAAASDTVKFSVAADNGHDTITGFSAGATATGGDVLHVTDTATLVGSGATGGTTATNAIYVGASAAGTKGSTAVSKVIAISDNAATDWSDVVAKMNGALTIATDATAGNQNTIIAIDNGVDTNVYLFSDDAGTDATVEVAELTLLGTLTGLADASTFVEANFGIA